MGKHEIILALIFENPIRKDIAYKDVIALIKWMGIRIEEAEGSRVIFDRDGFRLRMHRPHPTKEIKPYQVKEIREFIQQILEDKNHEFHEIQKLSR